MQEINESLFTPWKVGNVEIKNRIVMLLCLKMRQGGFLPDIYRTNLI